MQLRLRQIKMSRLRCFYLPVWQAFGDDGEKSLPAKCQRHGSITAF
jgi:hypothetical protein